jgi:hypothetical protein
MHPYYNAVLSARKHGDKPEDNLSLHAWFDSSDVYICDFRHRAVRHHAAGSLLLVNPNTSPNRPLHQIIAQQGEHNRTVAARAPQQYHHPTIRLRNSVVRAN